MTERHKKSMVVWNGNVDIMSLSFIFGHTFDKPEKMNQTLLTCQGVRGSSIQ